MVSFLLVLVVWLAGVVTVLPPLPLPVPGLRAEGFSIVVFTGIWVAKYVYP
jgi:hypothetical protein